MEILTRNGRIRSKKKDGSHMTAPAGLPLVQTALLSALELVHDGVLTIEQLAKKASHAVADCYKVLERGYLREGYWADIVLVDTEKTTTVHDADMRYKCGWTPYDGVTFRSAVDTVIMNGEVALDSGKFNDGLRGMKLKFRRRVIASSRLVFIRCKFRGCRYSLLCPSIRSS